MKQYLRSDNVDITLNRVYEYDSIESINKSMINTVLLNTGKDNLATYDDTVTNYLISKCNDYCKAKIDSRHAVKFEQLIADDLTEDQLKNLSEGEVLLYLISGLTLLSLDFDKLEDEVTYQKLTVPNVSGALVPFVDGIKLEGFDSIVFELGELLFYNGVQIGRKDSLPSGVTVVKCPDYILSANILDLIYDKYQDILEPSRDVSKEDLIAKKDLESDDRDEI